MANRQAVESVNRQPRAFYARHRGNMAMDYKEADGPAAYVVSHDERGDDTQRIASDMTIQSMPRRHATPAR